MNNVSKDKYIVWMEDAGMEDVGTVGGKNASLGEMIRTLGEKGIVVPSGFIITANGYRYFMRETGMDKLVKKTLHGLDTKNLKDLSERGKLVRDSILAKKMPVELEEQIALCYKIMESKYGRDIDVAVRSSATAEDLPGASFAGEHETYLGIRGARDVTQAAKAAFASLFTDRAISYRVDKGFDHLQIALSVGVQRMVRSDKGASGVMFTVDTESGFKNIVVINGSYGLGEMVVQGKVTPDEFLVFKDTINTAPKAIIAKTLGEKADKMIYSIDAKGIHPVKIIKTSPTEKSKFCLSDEEILKLARWGIIIEKHYSDKHGKWTPMDMEWAKDGNTGELFIVQARPETVQAQRDFSKVKEYTLKEKGTKLTAGVSVGNSLAIGKARVIMDAGKIREFKRGEVLVTDMTDPDWEPIMKIASAIITDKGGRTSHAAIVARELGIPAVIGTGNATRKIKTGMTVTVDTTGSDGIILLGALKFDITIHDLKTIPKTKTKVMLNIATPDTAFEKSFLPSDGVGLAREEFIIASEIGIHPLALLNYKKMAPALKKKINAKTVGYTDKVQFYVDRLAYGIGKIAAAFYPRETIVRFSDFKTNEYRSLLGGEEYEPVEENPMIGWRGASRYYDPKFKSAFQLECFAIKKVREEMGLDNVVPMVPFCRTIEEGKQTLTIMAESGLIAKSLAKKNQKSVSVYVMCEIPANILLADEFLDIFDGMSIGSNDLAQLTLGLDRDSGIVSYVANENNEAVKKMISEAISKCQTRGKYIGICGQAPSDYPEFAEFLVKEGIDSISLNPDSVIKTRTVIAEKEKELGINL